MKNFKSGTYINQGYYKSFQPNLINHPWVIENMEIITGGKRGRIYILKKYVEIFR